MNSRFLFLLTLLSLAGSGFAQDAGPLPLISVSGASAALEANIQALLSIDDERCDADLFRLESRRSQVRREVDRAAQGLGFYRLSQQLRFGRSDACWTLQIKVRVCMGCRVMTLPFPKSRPPRFPAPSSRLKAAACAHTQGTHPLIHCQ